MPEAEGPPARGLPRQGLRWRLTFARTVALRAALGVCRPHAGGDLVLEVNARTWPAAESIVFPVEARPLRLRGSPAPEPGQRAEREAGLAERTRARAARWDVFFQNLVSAATFQSPGTDASRRHVFPQGFHKKEQCQARPIGFIYHDFSSYCVCQAECLMQRSKR